MMSGLSGWQQRHRVRRAVIVGESAYTEPNQQLPGCKRDAEGVYAKFTGELGFLAKHSKLLIDSSRRAVLRAVEDMVEQMSGADVVAFYFSGHGSEKNGHNFICTIDGDIINIHTEVIHPINQKSQDAIVLIFLDCCRFNAQDVVFKGTGSSSVAVESMFERLTLNDQSMSAETTRSLNGRRSQFCIAYGCDPGSVSVEAGGQGVFTKALLKHAADPVSFQDMTLDVKAAVMATNHQRCWFNDALTQRFSLSWVDTANVHASAVPVVPAVPQPVDIPATSGRTGHYPIVKVVLGEMRKLASTSTPAEQASAADCLRNLASIYKVGQDPDWRATIAQLGAIQPLVRLLASTSTPAVQETAAAALLSLAANADNKVAIAQAGAIQPLVRLLASTSTPAVQKTAAGALLSLAANADNKVAIAQAGAIQPLVRMLASTSTEALPKVAAGALESLGIDKEAEPVQRQVLELRRKSLAPNHPNVASAVNSLAWCIICDGRAADAEDLSREAVTLARACMEPDDARLAYSIDTLATCLNDLQKFAEAEPLCHEALKLAALAGWDVSGYEKNLERCIKGQVLLFPK